MTHDKATKTHKGRRAQVGPDGFTDRQRELLTLLARGFDMTEAADRMQINVHTMRDSLTAIFKKMQASTQAEAVYRAVKEGVIK